MKKNKLKFNEKKHEYKIGKKKLTSVTQFIHKFFKPFNEREVARFLAKLNKYRKIKGKGVRYYLKEWKEAREHGTRCHLYIEKYINKELSIIEIKEIENEK